jgi:hypothetical protein
MLDLMAVAAPQHADEPDSFTHHHMHRHEAKNATARYACADR